MILHRLVVVTVLALLSSLAFPADYGSYKGKGGMAAHKIKPNVYEYHYDKGFLGPDAMGWDPNLQFAWSRFAAAKTCGLDVSIEKAIPNLIAEFQQDKLTHEMIGIGFHHAQSKVNPKFCTEDRVNELKALLHDLEGGNFPKKF